MSSRNQLIHVSPVNSSKLRMYLEPVIHEKQFENCSLAYNWFFCGKPSSYIKDGDLYKIIELSKRVSFFATKSGVTYKLKDKCKVRIVDKLPKNIDKLTKKNIDMGFQGIVYRKSKEGHDGREFDLVCSDVEFIFEVDALENANKCPYADYCEHHVDYDQHNKGKISSLELRRNFIESFK